MYIKSGYHIEASSNKSKPVPGGIDLRIKNHGFCVWATEPSSVLVTYAEKGILFAIDKDGIAVEISHFSGFIAHVFVWELIIFIIDKSMKS